MGYSWFRPSDGFKEPCLSTGRRWKLPAVYKLRILPFCPPVWRLKRSSSVAIMVNSEKLRTTDPANNFSAATQWSHSNQKLKGEANKSRLDNSVITACFCDMRNAKNRKSFFQGRIKIFKIRMNHGIKNTPRGRPGKCMFLCDLIDCSYVTLLTASNRTSKTAPIRAPAYPCLKAYSFLPCPFPSSILTRQPLPWNHFWTRPKYSRSVWTSKSIALQNTPALQANEHCHVTQAIQTIIFSSKVVLKARYTCLNSAQNWKRE